MLVLGTSEPVTGYGVGITPKLQYAFVGLDRLWPDIEGGGGPIWTDLGDRVPEQLGEFNFVVWGGAGGAWLLTPRWALNVGIGSSTFPMVGHVCQIPVSTSASRLPKFPIPSTDL